MSLFRALAARLGRHQAQAESRWIIHACRAHPHRLRPFLSRRINGEPLQYILGSTPFGPLDIITRPPTLIPRPETEHWSLALSHLLSSHHLSILDLCTGSGCIPLLLSASLPVKPLAIDISSDACQLATDNAANLGLPLTVRQDDILSPSFLDRIHNQRFHVVTCNPPYIPYHQYLSLPPSVKDYEDPRALLGDPHHLSPTPHPPPTSDGLTFYHALATLLPHLLLPSGAICAVEVGMSQAQSVLALFQKSACFSSLQVWKDPWGVERCIVGKT